MKIKHVLNTAQKDFLRYNGMKVEIIKEMSKELYDYDDVGPMYEVRLPDGNIIQAYEDELRPVQFGLICPYDDGSNRPKLAEVFFEENGKNTLNVDIYDISTLQSALDVYNKSKYGIECDSDDAFFIADYDPRYAEFMQANYTALEDNQNVFDCRVYEELEKLIDEEALKINNSICDYIARNYGSEIQDPAYNIAGIVCSIVDNLTLELPKTECLVVRALSENDLAQVQTLDELSGNYVSQWLDCEDYAYGIFSNNQCIGYCTIGGADDVCEEIEKHIKENDHIPEKNTGGLLSDVFIKAEFRGKSYGQIMVSEAIKLHREYNVIYCEPSTKKLSCFYERCGFKTFNYWDKGRFDESFPLMVHEKPQG